jgi:hypothetical protein
MNLLVMQYCLKYAEFQIGNDCIAGVGVNCLKVVAFVAHQKEEAPRVT